MSPLPQYWCVVPAAGVGARMKSNLAKQYLPLAGKVVLECTLDRLVSYSRIRQVVVAIGAADSHWQTLEVAGHSKVKAVEGGKARFQSVLNGLRSLAPVASEQDWVLVHDAARPCVRHSDIDALVVAVEESSVGGLLACPVQDTLKRAEGQQVIETVDRSRLWQAYTPQMFRFGLLLRALERSVSEGVAVTDEASAVESLGHRPLLIQGCKDNIKITHPEDLALAEIYWAQQREASL